MCRLLKNTVKYHRFTDETWFDNAINLKGLEATIKSLSSFKVTSQENRIAWALKAMTLTDLTTLAGDDCSSNVERLCIRACFPFSKDSIFNNHRGDSEFLNSLHVAAVCVYPTKVKDAHDTLEKLNMLSCIQIASGLRILCSRFASRSNKFSFFKLQLVFQLDYIL